jgi:hypothetical protein
MELETFAAVNIAAFVVAFIFLALIAKKLLDQIFD